MTLRALRDAAHLAQLQIRTEEGDTDAFLDLRAALRTSSTEALLLFHPTVDAAKATGTPFSYLDDLERGRRAARDALGIATARLRQRYRERMDAGYFGAVGLGGESNRLDVAAFLSRLTPEWHDEAACFDSGVDFFPRRGAKGIDPGAACEAAKAVCRRCPVVDDCLDYALSQGSQLVGIWGGTTQAERRGLKRRRSAA